MDEQQLQKIANDVATELPGVSFEHRQGVIIAIGDHLFDMKELLKAAGFQWDKTGKTWMKQAA